MYQSHLQGSRVKLKMGPIRCPETSVCQLLRDPTVRLHEVEVSLFSPFRPMLAERCNVRTVEESMKKSQFYYIETKYDGERFQVHVENGVFRYFSRNGYEYTDVYATLVTPHIAKLLRADIKSCILDGEMMGWNQNAKCYKSKGIDFDVKCLKVGDSIRPCLCIFDILLYNGQVLTNKPLSERLHYLENLFTPSEGFIMYTERKEVKTEQEVITELNLAIDCRLEGIVLKDPTSVYKPNTRKGGWYKIKPEYTDGLMDHVDFIIMGGYFGEGRRKGISHFLVGAAVPPAAEGNVYIKATEIVPSNAFKAEFTLRFPRVENIRYDKRWSDCMTITEFDNLRKEASGKLYSRHVDANDHLSESLKKKRRQLTRVPIQVGEEFRGIDSSEVSVTSHLLQGKEFCVLTAWKEHTKKDIETKIVQNGGTVVQNAGRNVFCVLTGDYTLRARNIVSMNQHNIARVDWLLRCIAAHELLPWTPADLFHATPTVKEQLSAKYDEFGDSYTQPLTKESLTFVLEKAGLSKTAVNFTEEMFADVEMELFSGPSPYGFFRPCRAYMDRYFMLNEPWSETSLTFDIVELDFTFYGGQISVDINDLTTHVIVHSESKGRLDEIKRLQKDRDHKFYIVTELWVIESVKLKRRKDECNYLL